jgi:hypothetical protein
MAANNFYLGLTMGDTANPESVVYTTSSNAGPANGTSSDVEVRIQTDPGTGANNITKQMVINALQTIISAIQTNGKNHAGAGLPAR